MKRLVLAAALMIAATGAALAGSLPASLRAAANIEGDTVKLGDLWDNLEEKADIVIAPAPQPGKRITADARWLTAVAQNYGVNWQPANMFERIVIERAGQTVDIKLIESELREALAAEGVQVPFNFEIINRSALSMVVPAAGGPIGVAVRDVIWDNRTSRFTATVEAPAGSPNALRQRINGHVFAVSRVPVLNRTIGRGDVITERDVEWVDARADAVRRDVITDIRQLVGQEPRLQVRQGAPVRASDLQRPVAVARNSTVTMVVKTPFMKLTTQGRAMEEGGKGDVIRVTNLNSKRVVEAVVEGPGMVAVIPNGAVALAN
ncbi:MAG TPA: flagellar basal body P-ring formation chaperone FlgA [Magnetospirillum sp.]|nr:flagellar basal body P-ring formation chaperone FlgA [Magnetospirillum sp.]